MSKLRDYHKFMFNLVDENFNNYQPRKYYYSETSNAVYIPLPGYKKEDIEIIYKNADNKTELTVKAKTKLEDDVVIVFDELFTINGNYDIHFEHENGMLICSLEEKEDSKPKKIILK